MLKIAILHSKRAPGLEALLQHPRRRVLFDVGAVLSSESAERPIRGRVREEYDSETAALLRRARVDIVLMLGYLYIATAPLLDAFRDRILNIHDADLTLRDATGGPRYPGLHATRDAISAGEHETRSSIHLVTPVVDGGPVLARSDAFPVASFVHEAAAAGANDIVRAYAYAQREWMMRSAWAELAVEGLRRMQMEAVA